MTHTLGCLCLVLALVACERGGASIAGPERLDAPVAWRGAWVTGVSPQAAVPVLEAAWQTTPRDWEPRGWRIVVHAERFPCAGATNAGTDGRCAGTTSTNRVIHLVPDEAVARFELCNARRWAVEGRLEDRGCQP